MTGKFPAILDDKIVGEAARSLYADAQKMLKEIVEQRWFKAAAAFGFWPANAVGDDIEVFADAERGKPIATLRTLRQQLSRREGRANVALADFVAPKGHEDHVGAFVVTAGIGEDAVADRFKNANDDYSSIMVKALADRLAESFAERLHQRVRKEFWGYAADEALSNADLIAEKYRGIRPAPGYPAQPDHTEKGTLFKLLEGERIGVKLTESFAMWPGASVCGLYFGHPESHYFGVGKIERDQVEDYARRKGWSVAEGERWLAPILNYDPNAPGAATPRRDSHLKVPQNKTPEGEALRCAPYAASLTGSVFRVVPTQKAPSSTAPTKAIAAKTARTFSRKARSTYWPPRVKLGWSLADRQPALK